MLYLHCKTADEGHKHRHPEIIGEDLRETLQLVKSFVKSYLFV